MAVPTGGQWEAHSPSRVQRRAYLSKHDDVKADAIRLGECALLVASEVPVVLGKPGGQKGRLGKKCRSWVPGGDC